MYRHQFSHLSDGLTSVFADFLQMQKFRMHQSHVEQVLFIHFRPAMRAVIVVPLHVLPSANRALCITVRTICPPRMHHRCNVGGRNTFYDLIDCLVHPTRRACDLEYI